MDLVGYINAKYGGPGTTILNATLHAEGKDRTVLRISDSHYGRVSDGLVSSLNTGWQMLFNNGLKAFVEAD